MERKTKCTRNTKADKGGSRYPTLMGQEKPGSHPVEGQVWLQVSLMGTILGAPTTLVPSGLDTRPGQCETPDRRTLLNPTLDLPRNPLLAPSPLLCSGPAQAICSLDSWVKEEGLPFSSTNTLQRGVQLSCPALRWCFSPLGPLWFQALSIFKVLPSPRKLSIFLRALRLMLRCPGNKPLTGVTLPPISRQLF